MDSVVMEESLNSEVAGNDFVDKQWLYVNDNNNQSYTGQVVVDTTSLSNSGAYLNWSEAFLLFPLILQMDWTATSGAGLGAGSELDWVQGMKSGYWNILHNMSVEFNNSTVVQQSNFLNVFCSFKANTSWSDADVKNWGSVTGYCPDTSTSWVFNATANSATNSLGASGCGLCNNRNGLFLPIVSNAVVTATPITVVRSVQQTTADMASSHLYSLKNEGFYQRQKWLNFSLNANNGSDSTFRGSNQAFLLGGSSVASSATPLASATPNTNFAGVFMSCVTSTATTRSVIFPAIVRLKDVCDFFAKCPLLKGSTMRFYMNTNQVQFLTQSAQTQLVIPAVIGGATTITAGSMGLVGQPTILGGGQTNPVMVASCDLGQGCENLLGTAGASAGILHTLSIAKTQFLSAVAVPAACGGGTITAAPLSAPITSVRLYCPAYTFAPLAEARYLSLAPTKKIIYNDIFQYTIPSTALALGSTFSVLVTNGIPNLRSIVAMGFIPTPTNTAGNTNGNGTTTGDGNFQSTAVGSLQSPFTSSGGSPDPIIIQNFQIQVSGKNLFINQLYYDYEQFVEQLVSSNQLNGSLTTSLGSGQISQMDFQRLYRYYYGNVSRHLPSEDGVSKSIQLLGQIAGGIAPTMLVFCEFEKEIVVDVRSGMRIV